VRAAGSDEQIEIVRFALLGAVVSMIPTFVRRCCLTLAVAAFTSGCGGKSQGTGAKGGSGGGSASPDGGVGEDGLSPCELRSTYTSVEAVRIARCSSALPESALLVSLVSDGSATLDSTGHDVHWSSTFWEPTTQVVYFVTINALGSEVSQTPEPLDCGPGMEPLDSAIIAPDAIQRLGTADVPLFMRQMLGCIYGDTPTPDQRYVAASKRGGYTFVLYDSTGGYLTTCPCTHQDATQCDCFP